MTFDVDNPFDQSEWYYSESARELVRIAGMPIPHLAYAFAKLLREYKGDFYKSKLEEAMIRRLRPTTKQLKKYLSEYGSALYWAGGNTTPTRSKFYSIGKRMGVKIRTHKKMIGGMVFIEGVVVAEIKVTARPVKTKVSA